MIKHFPLYRGGGEGEGKGPQCRSRFAATFHRKHDLTKRVIENSDFVSTTGEAVDSRENKFKAKKNISLLVRTARIPKAT